MYRKAKTIVLAGLITVTMIGCDGLLEATPRQSIEPETATSSVAALRGLSTGTYHRLMSQNLYGQRLLLVPDVLADNSVRGPSPSGRLLNEFFNTLGAGIPVTNTYFHSYQTINQLNMLIEGATNIEVLAGDQPQVDRLRAEALAMRGLVYHNLVKIYGYDPGQAVGGWNHGVVIRTEATMDVADADDHRARASVADVYTQIKADMLEAISIMNGLPTGAQRNIAFGDRTRLNIHAVRGLLARVYLYERSWLDAENMATAAIEGTAAVLSPNPLAAFQTQPNPESLFQLSIANTEHHPGTGRNEGLAALTQPSGSLSWGDVALAPGLVALFEADDTRRSLFRQVGTFWFTNKYAHHVTANTDNMPVIRLPELYLIRAEARARQPAKEILGLADLNELRAARQASVVVAAGQALLDAIQVERRLELHLEGHRWFDLKRTGQTIPKAQAGVAPIPYADVRILAPLPQRDVDLNDLLVQNPGY
jgi:starch-binding outer membrane protein, SusD/RagB family